MRVLSDYDWFWIGRSKTTKMAVEEWIKTLRLKYTTQSDIALKHGINSSTINSCIKELIEKKLIDLPDISYDRSNICVICKKNPATQTHHLNYNPEVVISVCVSCHSRIHQKGTGSDIVKKQEKFLLKLPFEIIFPENRQEKKAKYIRLYRMYKKTGNSDEVKVLAKKLNLEVQEKQ